jgi:hypothetical protein
MTRPRIKPKKDTSTVLSPAIRLRHIEMKLQRFLKLLRCATPGNIVKACAEAGTCTQTFRRFKELYMSGGEDAVRRELARRRGDSTSVFMEVPGRSKR